jgi:hypothetical protein
VRAYGEDTGGVPDVVCPVGDALGPALTLLR